MTCVGLCRGGKDNLLGAKSSSRYRASVECKWRATSYLSCCAHHPNSARRPFGCYSDTFSWLSCAGVVGSYQVQSVKFRSWVCHQCTRVWEQDQRWPRQGGQHRHWRLARWKSFSTRNWTRRKIRSVCCQSSRLSIVPWLKNGPGPSSTSRPKRLCSVSHLVPITTTTTANITTTTTQTTTI